MFPVSSSGKRLLISLNFHIFEDQGIFSKTDFFRNCFCFLFFARTQSSSSIIFFFKMDFSLKNTCFYTTSKVATSGKRSSPSFAQNLSDLTFSCMRSQSYRNRSSHQSCSMKKGVLARYSEKRLCHRCFPVNFAKFLRTPFFRTPPHDCFFRSN